MTVYSLFDGLTSNFVQRRNVKATIYLTISTYSLLTHVCSFAVKIEIIFQLFTQPICNLKVVHLPDTYVARS